MRVRHTKCRYNLSLQAELLLEAWHNIVDPTTAVTSNIRNLADVVKHVTTDEQ